MTIGARIAGRCHVGDSPLSVCRAVYLAFKRSARHDPAFRAARRACYRDALAAHEANRKLYRDMRF